MAELSEVARECGIKNFLISYTDLFGHMRAKLVPARAIDKMAREGAGFAGFATWLDMTPAMPDLFAVPDPDSLVQLPWKREVGWLSGSCLLVRRSVFENLGGFDEGYFMYFEDVDLCARIRRAGHEIHFISGISVEHLGGGSQSGGKSLLVEKEFRNSQVLCYSRHSSTLDNVLLRIYLFIRFFPQLLPGDRERREVASHVLSILLRPAHERRH